MTEIRDLRPDDLDEVLEIETTSFLSPWSRAVFEQTLCNPVASGFAAIVDGVLAGYLLLYHAGPEAHILNLAIDPGRRRHGLGSRLLSHAVAEMKRRGIEEFYLEVREGNGPAIGLYRSNGFEVIGKRKRYYQETGEDALVMLMRIG